MNNETINNARRLIYGLYQSTDENTLRYLSHYLHYDCQQLATDIKDLQTYVEYLQRKVNEDNRRN